MRGLVLAIVCCASVAHAQNALTITDVRVDRATLHTAGIQVLISGDGNRDATITVRVRVCVPGAVFRDALPLFRVLPETVTGRTVPEQFAGTIFDLVPGQTFDVELTATDPDGGGEVRMISVTTRALPHDPAAPRAVSVASAVELQAALTAAQPGDVITLAAGTYTGEFVLGKSGTADNPIVIRGTSQATTILDGQNCASCNILEISGSYIHVDHLTVQNGLRAIRFLGNATTGNVVSHTLLRDVVHGVGAGTNQTDFTICDNAIHGRLQWPLVYSDDGAIHADDQGVRVDGSGHVVCHNDISGFGDPMINFTEGGRAYDFYGNDIHEIYGDGTELDRGEGNVRLFGNRWTNVYTAISIQPAYGGPTYVLRNQVVNVADEQIKLKSVGGTVEPSGVLIYHNTFVSPKLALNLQTPITQHNFVIANNLFVTTAPPARVVDWTAKLDRGEFDNNAYAPDGGFWFGTAGATPRTFASFAAAQAAGVETHGILLTAPIFASGFTAPADYKSQLAPPDLALAATSNALDIGRALPGINTNHNGAGPDLGAFERGCAPFTYGPRPDGMESTTNPVDCSASNGGPGDGPGTDSSSGGNGDGGCCDSGSAPTNLPLALLVALALTARSRTGRRVRTSR
jgi:hypothetical protein